MKRHLLAIGICYVDIVLDVPHYPREDEKLRATNFIRRRGGTCPNILEILQQFHQADGTTPALSLKLAAVLPSQTSPDVSIVRSSFHPGVDLSTSVFREEFHEAACCVIVRSRETGSRTILSHNELPEMTEEEFVRAVDQVDGELGWCHFEGRLPEVKIEWLHHLRQRHPNISVSVEVEKPGRPGLQELANEADVVFYSKDWAEANGHTDVLEFLASQAAIVSKPSLLCCTWGADGAAAMDARGHNAIRCPARPVPARSVIDTIGAGDTFAAGMLYGLMQHSEDWDLGKKLDFAVELAGRKVMQEGFGGLSDGLEYL